MVHTQQNEAPDAEKLNRLRARVNAAKIAYLSRTPFEGLEELTYEVLRSIAQDFIKESYHQQRLLYGKVRVKISVAKLLRSR